MWHGYVQPIKLLSTEIGSEKGFYSEENIILLINFHALPEEK